jgi:hypothetical protein
MRLTDYAHRLLQHIPISVPGLDKNVRDIEVVIEIEDIVCDRRLFLYFEIDRIEYSRIECAVCLIFLFYFSS